MVLANEVNATNIKNIVPELFEENLIRGRGLLLKRVVLQLKRACKRNDKPQLLAASKLLDSSLLQDLSPKALHGIFERFRGILHEGETYKRLQFLIESLFAIRKAKFQGYPAVLPELDLVDRDDQLTHELSLEDVIDPESCLDIFKADASFLENERHYDELKRNILGDESSLSEDEAGSDEESDDEKTDIRDETVI
ncbi:hypothetical protein IFM89_016705 [Coptis chinensis]|uniref:Uncharacterized protein n=1 Tax=Coptis chinensis TaxID=261450 RepID=A0A835INJ3_9MAGN|nr:hypothetical protein IFM89_016705 [Coptis chinensis]